MIAYVKGRLIKAEKDRLILDHDGIGIQIFVPSSVLEQLPPAMSEVKVYTYLYVREDVLCLYGFLTEEDVRMFIQLLGVSGIGPRGALAILSSMSSKELRYAIYSEDVKSLSRADGVGTKTAKKMILELKDKIERPSDSFAADSKDQGPVHVQSEGITDAVLALMALGYSRTEALSAVEACGGTEDMSGDEILSLALRAVATSI